MNAPESLDWICRLIAIDSTSRNSNRPIIDLIAAEAERLELPVQRFVARDDDSKFNMVISVPDAEGNTAGGLMLSGHSDVVPVDNQQWTTDPFEPEVRDGRLYGRGAADMKSFIGVVMDRLEAMSRATLQSPIHLAISFDEEVGCRGGAQFAEFDLAESGLTPAYCFVGEPSSMEVIAGHKSINSTLVRFHGVTAHSSLTSQGVNAVEYAAKFTTFMRDQFDAWRTEGPFDEAYPITFTTGSVNRFHGGTAGNIVPDFCEVEVEFRSHHLVDVDAMFEKMRAYADELQTQMQAENEQASVEFTILSKVPGLDTPLEAEVVDLAVSLGGHRSDGKVTYATEAGQFSGAGVPSVVVGPGSIEQAHKADEWIALDQIVECEQFIDNLIAWASADAQASNRG